ncbi:hypothetical protein [[Eubacterium] cellulosolvens]
MVVQTTQQQEQSFNFVQIPNEIPGEILENDSLLVLEKGLNQLEDRLIVTARSVLGLNTELQTQLTEIDRLESAIISMHEFITLQQQKIEALELQVANLKNSEMRNSIDSSDNKWSRFWSRLFLK